VVKTNDYDNRNDRAAALLEEAIKNLGPELIANPQLAEILNRKIDDQLNEYYANQNGKGIPTDGGLSDLIGLGKDAPTNLGDTQISRGVIDYDDTVTSDRILASADLFISETAKYWRDKRISEAIRQNAPDPTFGSVAIVRRSGLDLRNNLKNSSYGYINVLRVETSQALAEAFKVLEAPDVRAQFGADNAWESIELVLWQYFRESVHASTMNRLAVTGREILRWLAEPFVLKKSRTEFEALLYRIAESSEEWISSEEGMRLSRPTPPPRNVYAPGAPPTGQRRDPVFARSNGLMPAPRVVG
jgi:hypothetical protein